MDGFLGSLMLCLLVLGISIVASIVASYLVYRSMKRRVLGAPSSIQVSTVYAGSTGVAGSADSGAQYDMVPAGERGATQVLISSEEGIEVRNLILRTMAPRPEELLIWAKQKWPNATRDQLANKLIASTASKCGFIGFVTGVPGLVALPVTLPIDIVATGRLQAVMVQSLAYLYELDDDPDDAQRRNLMIIVGGGSLARSLTQISIKIIGPSMLKAVPIVGAIAGYAANYGLAQFAGQTAKASFSGSIKRTTGRLAEVAKTRRITTAQLPAKASPPTEPIDVDATVIVQTDAPLSASRLQAEIAATSSASEPERRFCTRCGQSNPADFRFCNSCGAASTA